MPKCWVLKEKIKGTYLEETWSFPFFLLSISMELFPLDKIFLLYTYSNCAFFPTSPFSVYFIEGKDLSNKNYFDVNGTGSSGHFFGRHWAKTRGKSSCSELIRALLKPVISSYKDLKSCENLKEHCNMLYMVVNCILLVFMLPHFITHTLVLAQSLYISACLPLWFKIRCALHLGQNVLYPHGNFRSFFKVKNMTLGIFSTWHIKVGLSVNNWNLLES